MSNYVNYCSHVINEPPYYQRVYEHDVKLPESGDSTWPEKAQRVALLAVPFLSLYRPVGTMISLGMGSCRCVTHIWEAISAGQAGKLDIAAWEMVQIALAVLAIVGTLFNFTFGLLITSGVDLVTCFIEMIKHLKAGEYEKAIEDLLQVLSSVLYIGIILTGNLEVILVSILIQAVVSFVQSRKEFLQGRYPEAVAKFAMGMIRCSQARQTVLQIYRRNEILALDRFRQIIERIQRGKEVRDLIANPLHDASHENPVILTDAEGKEYDFGSHFHGFGKSAVKGANLSLRTKVIDGKEVTELDFKVNHVFREHLQNMIQEVEQLQGQDLNDALALTHSHIKEIKVDVVPSSNVEGIESGDFYKITFAGIGTMYVGNSIYRPNSYDRVVVQMDKGKNLYDLHELLAITNLQEAIRSASSADLERLKMGHLFRVFCPKEATPFERTEEFFNLSLDELKKEMVKRAPVMQEIFNEYLSKMEAREILPGKVRYAIPGLATRAHNLGARGLIAAITGTATEEETFSRAASILKMGLLSIETRFTGGIQSPGMSIFADLWVGSSDSVFTQLITEKNIQENMSLDSLYYQSKVRLIFSLDALETGSYQYHEDSLGSRRTERLVFDRGEIDYFNRPGIDEFVKRENSKFSPGNEVMIKERISPSMIKGLIVRDHATRDQLISFFRQKDLIQRFNESETILGMTLDKFIRVGSSFSEELIG